MLSYTIYKSIYNVFIHGHTSFLLHFSLSFFLFYKIVEIMADKVLYLFIYFFLSFFGYLPLLIHGPTSFFLLFFRPVFS